MFEVEITRLARVMLTVGGIPMLGSFCTLVDGVAGEHPGCSRLPIQLDSFLRIDLNGPNPPVGRKSLSEHFSRNLAYGK